MYFLYYRTETWIKVGGKLKTWKSQVSMEFSRSCFFLFNFIANKVNGSACHVTLQRVRSVNSLSVMLLPHHTLEGATGILPKFLKQILL